MSTTIIILAVLAEEFSRVDILNISPLETDKVGDVEYKMVPVRPALGIMLSDEIRVLSGALLSAQIFLYCTINGVKRSINIKMGITTVEILVCLCPR